MGTVEGPDILFGNSKWIWAGDGTKKNSTVILRKTFSFGTEKPPARAICHAACNTRYYLYVNGNAAVWNGGFNRGVKNSYYDEFDIAKFLNKGDNVIVVYCRFYGSEGRDLVPAPRAGFIFECNDLKIYSDVSFTAYDNPAYKTAPKTNCCYAGESILYDASLEGQIQNVLDPSFNSSLFGQATVLDGYPDGQTGVLLPRPLPLERFSAQPVVGRARKSTDQFDGDRYTIPLPREMTVTPYLEVTGNGQEKVTICTDRTDCHGTFGDENSIYRAHFIEYLTKPTVNIFEGLLPMTGHELIFSMPRTVHVLKLGYREIGYNTSRTAEFETDDQTANKLFDKALATLYCCMGSTLMDTPERERTMWLGDSSIAARALYLGFANAGELVRKVLGDIIDGAAGDVLNSCVPGNVPVDIPSHGLFALSEYGIFAHYYNYDKNIDFLRGVYGKLCDFLMLWNMTPQGVELREGSTRRWYDNLYNIDEALLENAMYYSACKFLKSLGAALNNHDYDEDIDDRMSNIADFIEACWDGLGYCSRQDGYDDRANAWIALCGLVPADRKAAVSRILCSTYSCSPYMEWAVLEALTKLGDRKLALNRFMSRYSVVADDSDTTLGEDFNGYGTKCHSYQSAIIFELIELFGGIEIKSGASQINITPDFTALKDFRCSLKLASGELDVRYKYSPARIDILIDNRTDGKIVLDISPERIGRKVERRTLALNKGKNKFTI